METTKRSSINRGIKHEEEDLFFWSPRLKKSVRHSRERERFLEKREKKNVSEEKEEELKITRVSRTQMEFIR